MEKLDTTYDGSLATITRTMLLGKILFVATLSSFISEDTFYWTLKFQQQLPPSFSYQCTVNQKLFSHVSERYNFSSPQKFFELIKESLFEGKGLKTLGYYFGDSKKRIPEDGSLPLILEITIELYTVMRFKLILDPLQGIIEPQYNYESSLHDDHSSTNDELKKLIEKLTLDISQDQERILKLERTIDLLTGTVALLQSEIQTLKSTLFQEKVSMWGIQQSSSRSGCSIIEKKPIEEKLPTISEEKEILQPIQIQNLQTSSEISPLQKLSSLFTGWNASKTHKKLVILNNNRTVRCMEGGESVSTLGNAIFEEGIHEWSIHVDNISIDGTILIGLADPEHDLERKCGFASHSYAFSVTDKNIFHMGIPKQITFPQDTVVSVGIVLNLSNLTLSIQINEEESIVAYESVAPPLVPCVTMSGIGTQVSLHISGRKF